MSRCGGAQPFLHQPEVATALDWLVLAHATAPVCGLPDSPPLSSTPFPAMDAILAAQKALVVLVTSCTTGPAVQRPCFGAVGRALRDIQRTYHKARKGGTPRSTPASTPRPTPRGGAVAS